MKRITHEHMATAFQLTAIVFIFTYTVSPVQKMKPGAIKDLPVSQPGKAEKIVIPQPKNITHAVTTSKNIAVNHNFSWKVPAVKTMVGADAITFKKEAAVAGHSSFPEFVSR